jgi:ankyrin repeat protein
MDAPAGPAPDAAVASLERALARPPRLSRSAKLFKLVSVHPDLAGPAVLLASAQDAHSDLVRKMLALGVSPLAQDSDGATALHFAIVNDPTFEVCRLLLRAGADVDATDFDGNTPLHEAALAGIADGIVWLLRHGASTDATNSRGQSPRQLASQFDTPHVLAAFDAASSGAANPLTTPSTVDAFSAAAPEAAPDAPTAAADAPLTVPEAVDVADAGMAGQTLDIEHDTVVDIELDENGDAGARESELDFHEARSPDSDTAATFDDMLSTSALFGTHSEGASASTGNAGVSFVDSVYFDSTPPPPPTTGNTGVSFVDSVYFDSTPRPLPTSQQHPLPSIELELPDQDIDVTRTPSPESPAAPHVDGEHGIPLQISFPSAPAPWEKQMNSPDATEWVGEGSTADMSGSLNNDSSTWAADSILLQSKFAPPPWQQPELPALFTRESTSSVDVVDSNSEQDSSEDFDVVKQDSISPHDTSEQISSGLDHRQLVDQDAAREIGRSESAKCSEKTYDHVVDDRERELSIFADADELSNSSPGEYLRDKDVDVDQSSHSFDRSTDQVLADQVLVDDQTDDEQLVSEMADISLDKAIERTGSALLNFSMSNSSKHAGPIVTSNDEIDSNEVASLDGEAVTGSMQVEQREMKNPEHVYAGQAYDEDMRQAPDVDLASNVRVEETMEKETWEAGEEEESTGKHDDEVTLELASPSLASFSLSRHDSHTRGSEHALDGTDESDNGQGVPPAIREARADMERAIGGNGETTDFGAVCELLEAYGSAVSRVGNPARNSQTALHRAAFFGRADIVELILTESGDCVGDVESLHNCTALMLAAKKGRMDVVSLIVEAGGTAIVDVADKYGNTALHHAAIGGHLETGIGLIVLGADPNIANEDFRTPCDEAVQFEHTATAEMLQVAVARHMVPDELKNMLPELSTACIGPKDLMEIAIGYPGQDSDVAQIVALVRHYGKSVVNFKAHRRGGQSCLHRAVYHQKTDAVRSLLVYGADVNALEDCFGSMPLHTAAAAGDAPEIVDILAEFGADMNAGSAYGAPIHLAVANGHYNIVQKLLMHGASTDMPDSEGKTPLRIAKELHLDQISHLLIRVQS